MAFYALGRPVTFLITQKHLLAFFEKGGVRYAIVTPEFLEVRKSHKGTVEELGRWKMHGHNVVFVLLRATPGPT